MTVRKKIFLSNTIMVLLALLVLLGVGGLLISLFRGEFMDRYGTGSEISQYTGDAQALLKSPDTDWKVLAQKLGKYDFRLYVTSGEDDGHEPYDNLKHSEHEAIDGIRDESLTAGSTRMYLIEGATIIRTSVKSGGIDYAVYAVDCPDGLTFWGIDRGMFEMFLIIFLCTGLVTIGLIMLLSQLVTKLLIKQIMKPVENLTAATDRMASGDLSQPIGYERKDEFKTVCDSFDEMQQKLKEGIEQKEQYEKARTEMISDISHDLRTPLTSIKGYIKGLMDGIADTDEKRKHYLETAYRRSCDMDGLLSKLFFFSRLETGSLPFYMKEQDMCAYLNDYILQKQQEFQDRLVIESDIHAADISCSIDGEQLRRVFDNLIENSIKYAGSSDLRIKVSMKETEAEGRKMCEISFCDNGSGVEPEKLGRVFERFYRADDARNSKCEGNGLGLFICRYIAEAHDGIITAENDNGFCVRMMFPVTDRSENGTDTDSRG